MVRASAGGEGPQQRQMPCAGCHGRPLSKVIAATPAVGVSFAFAAGTSTDLIAVHFAIAAAADARARDRGQLMRWSSAARPRLAASSSLRRGRRPRRSACRRPPPVFPPVRSIVRSRVVKASAAGPDACARLSRDLIPDARAPACAAACASIARVVQRLSTASRPAAAPAPASSRADPASTIDRLRVASCR